MPSKTPAKRPLGAHITRVKLSVRATEEAKAFLPPRTNAAFADTLHALEAEFTHLRFVLISRREQPLPANLKAELEQIGRPTKQLLARLNCLPFDNDGRPSMTADAEFELRANDFDLSSLRSLLQGLMANIDVAQTRLAAYKRSDSDGGARNRMLKAVRAAAAESLSRFYRKHAAPARRSMRNRERDFIVWALKQVSHHGKNNP